MKKLTLIISLLFILAVAPALAGKNDEQKNKIKGNVEALENCNSGGDWKNHGSYVSCVAKYRLGGFFTSLAARSNIGKKSNPAVTPTPVATPSVSPLPTPSPSPSPSASPLVSPSPSPSPSASPSVSPSPSPEATINTQISQSVDKQTKALIQILQNIFQLLQKLV